MDALLAHCRHATHTLSQASSPHVTSTSDVLLRECDAALVDLLSRQAALVLRLHDSDADDVDQELLQKRLEDVISLTNRKFYHGAFGQVTPGWREMYAAAHALKFHHLILRSCLASGRDGQDKTKNENKDMLRGEQEVSELVRVLDYGLIVSGGPGETCGRNWVNEALAMLETAWDRWAAEEPTASTAAASATAYDRQELGVLENTRVRASRPIMRVPAMEVHEFENYLRRFGLPIVFAGMASSWPAAATHRWKDARYLLGKTFGGRRLVPVEVGRSYVDEGWGQQLVTVREFTERWVLGGDGKAHDDDEKEENKRKKKEPGYLAQHNLFAQMPSLAADVPTPDLCFSEPPPGARTAPKLGLPLRNAWFGPSDTITPLHTDPYHNLLCQVVGSKYVRLYSPDKTGLMRAHGVEDGVDMANTGGVDVGVVEGWDDDRGGGMTGDEKAEFRKVAYLDCVLGEGDVLYLPPGWWHYCRALSVSFSVSFWWN